MVRWARFTSAAGLAVVLPFGALSGPSVGTGGQGAHHGSLIVTTDAGAIGGKNAEGTDQFLGIPYAAPPAGALRWEAPQPVTPWHGVHSAQSDGNRCPQLPSGNGPRSDTEDCLYLNVFTPPGSERGQTARPGAGHLPVLVMIHGGGLVNGSGGLVNGSGGLVNGSGDQHDGSLIVTTDHIVVVSINYRLGVFGSPARTSGACGPARRFRVIVVPSCPRARTTTTGTIASL